MELPFTNCWDCPASIRGAMIVLIIGIAILGLAVFLRYWNWQFGKGLSVILFLAAAFWYVFVTAGILRLGVRWGESPFETNDVKNVALLSMWYVVSAGVGWFLRKRRSNFNHQAAT